MHPYVPPEQLVDGLVEAFTLEEFRAFLQTRLAQRLDTFANAKWPYRQQAMAVVEAAERAEWMQKLIEAVYRERPRSPVIAGLYEQLGLAPRVVVREAGVERAPVALPSFALPAGGLESATVRGAGGFELAVEGQDLDLWTNEVTRVTDRVCRVEDEWGFRGTGFLVGPDAVLTAPDVLANLLAGKTPLDQVQFRFDYRVLSDGMRSDGVAVGLHPTDWLIDTSPLVPDEAHHPDAVPTEGQLGYLLLRLAEPIGRQPPAGARGGTPRGWVWVPDKPHPLRPGTPIIIAHYPGWGDPLEITFDTKGVIGPNANRTRVRYSATTRAGSSGAPCFDGDWAPFAMHQLGDPAHEHGRQYRRGRGVPTAAIRDRLTRLGKAGALGGKT